MATTAKKKAGAARLAWVKRLPEAGEIRRHYDRALEIEREIEATQERLRDLRAQLRHEEKAAAADAAQSWTGEEIAAAKRDPDEPTPPAPTSASRVREQPPAPVEEPVDVALLRWMLSERREAARKRRARALPGSVDEQRADAEIATLDFALAAAGMHEAAPHAVACAT